VYKLRSDNF